MKKAFQLQHFKSSDPYDRYVHLIVFSAMISCLTFLSGNFKSVQSAPFTKAQGSEASLIALHQSLTKLDPETAQSFGYQVRQTSAGIEVHLNVGKLFYPGDDSFAPRQSQALKALMQGLALEKHDVYVEIEAHTDISGLSRTAWKFGDNWGLSAARAARVGMVLREIGFPPSRLKVSGRGPAVAASLARNIASTGELSSPLLDRRIVLYISEVGFANRERTP